MCSTGRGQALDLSSVATGSIIASVCVIGCKSFDFPLQLGVTVLANRNCMDTYIC